MFKKILVPVDGSHTSSMAVDMAIDVARHYDASILLLHVIRNLSLPQEILQMIAKGEITESRMELLQDSADIILDSAREQVEKAGLTPESVEYLVGDPAATIIAYAEEHQADLIVIGARGMETEYNLLGGVARKLTNIAKLPVLVVR